MNSARRHLRRDSQESLSLVCQNYQCSKRSRLLIFGPGRSEKTPEGRDLPLHLSRRFSERRQDAFVEVALSKPGNSKAQTLACFRKRFAEEFEGLGLAVTGLRERDLDECVLTTF